VDVLGGEQPKAVQLQLEHPARLGEGLGADSKRQLRNERPGPAFAAGQDGASLPAAGRNTRSLHGFPLYDRMNERAKFFRSPPGIARIDTSYSSSAYATANSGRQGRDVGLQST
jgi:hypothetical protein